MFLPGFLEHPLVFNLLVLAASLYILFKSADLIVDGISDYARKLGLSDAIIGLVVVAMAASAPEVISSVIGFMGGETGVGYGAIIGANMVHAAFALGIVTVLGRKIALESTIFTKRRFIMWIALMLPFVLAIDGQLSRADGIVLIGVFIAYLAQLWHQEGTLGKIKKTVKLKAIWKDAFIFLGCFVALMLSGKWLVFSAVQLSNYFNLPSYFVALTVIGIGTTIPDIAIEVKSLYKAHASIGLGDLLGSLIIELVLFFGVVSLFAPINVGMDALNAMIFLAIAITLMMWWMDRKYLTWKHGITFLSIYAVFLAIEIYKIV
ncbi:sodium:calcium antiporter [Candidatus Woesearchaeota archaeon]|nr:sodium:calcium antiporter [Candidatus Woesearchaeota archaeon]